MECPRCHHRIIPGVLFCPECEAPLKVIWEETNPMGSSVWEYDGEGDESGTGQQTEPEGHAQSEGMQKLSLPISRDLRPRS